MIKIYGSTDNTNTHVDTSRTLLGAKQYATRNNYRNVSVRIGCNVTLLEYKMNDKWYKYQDFIDDIFKKECDDCQTIASDVDALAKYNKEKFV